MPPRPRGPGNSESQVINVGEESDSEPEPEIKLVSLKSSKAAKGKASGSSTAAAGATPSGSRANSTLGSASSSSAAKRAINLPKPTPISSDSSDDDLPILITRPVSNPSKKPSATKTVSATASLNAARAKAKAELALPKPEPKPEPIAQAPPVAGPSAVGAPAVAPANHVGIIIAKVTSTGRLPNLVDAFPGTRADLWAEAMPNVHTAGTVWVTRRVNMLAPATPSDLKVGMLSPRCAMLFADGGPAKAAGLRASEVFVSADKTLMPLSFYVFIALECNNGFSAVAGQLLAKFINENPYELAVADTSSVPTLAPLAQVQTLASDATHPTRQFTAKRSSMIASMMAAGRGAGAMLGRALAAGMDVKPDVKPNLADAGPSQPGVAPKPGKHYIMVDGQMEEIDVGAEDAAGMIRAGEGVDELLNNMAAGQYRGVDALEALFGNEASFDVANLPLYVDTDDLVTRGLRTPLHRHQLQGLRWMVQHEQPKMPQSEDDDPVMLYKARKNGRGKVYWWQIAEKKATRKPPSLPRGGILADGMGLGKTLQIIALIISDPTGRGAESDDEDEPMRDVKPKGKDKKGKGKGRLLTAAPVKSEAKGKGKAKSNVESPSKKKRKSWRRADSDDSDAFDSDDAKLSFSESDKSDDLVLADEEDMDFYDDSQFIKTTLVVCPLSITTQWQTQIEQHTAGIKCIVYHGQVTKQVKDLSQYDVVITTYDTLKGQHKAVAERRLKIARLNQFNDEMDQLDDKLEEVKADIKRRKFMSDLDRAALMADKKALEERMVQAKFNFENADKKPDTKRRKKRKGKGKKKARTGSSSKSESTAKTWDADSDFGQSDGDDAAAYSSDSDVLLLSKKAPPPAKIGPLFLHKFRRCVLDEAHVARNPKTAIYQAILDVKCQRRWSLTGTPIVNGTKDLGSLARWHGLRPFADEESAWSVLVETPIRKERRSGSSMLSAVVRALTLRRVKSMTDENGKPLVELPPIEIAHHKVNLLSGDREYYDKVETAFKERIVSWLDAGILSEQRGVWLVLLMRLRQLCCHRSLISPKFLEMIKTHDFAQGVAPGADLDQVSIEALQDKLAAFVSAGEECPICLTALLNKEPVITPCSHTFCKECIEQVIATSAKCPLDRRPLPPGSKLIKMPEAKPDELYTEGDGGSASGSAKLQEIVRIVRAIEHRDPTEKILVFSNFTSFLNLVSAKLTEEDIPHCRYDGSMNLARRDKSLASFARPIPGDGKRRDYSQANQVFAADLLGPSKSIVDLLKSLDKDRQAATGKKPVKRRTLDQDEREGIGKTIPRVMLLTLGAGSLGLNLTAASVVIICDPWWQSAIEAQAVDRIHRIGQKRKCLVFHFVAENTIETRMQEIQERKEGLTATAFSGFTAHGRKIADPRARRETGMRDLATVIGLPAHLVERIAREGGNNR